MDKWEAWCKYKKYLKQWIVDHDGRVFYGMSLMSFESWVENNGICIQC